MMYINSGNTASGRAITYQWRVGEPNPFNHNPELAQFVTSILADGDELQYITRYMVNLPMADSLVVRWYGDHAKFIVGNL